MPVAPYRDGEAYRIAAAGVYLVSAAVDRFPLAGSVRETPLAVVGTIELFKALAKLRDAVAIARSVFDLPHDDLDWSRALVLELVGDDGRVVSEVHIPKRRRRRAIALRAEAGRSARVAASGAPPLSTPRTERTVH